MAVVKFCYGPNDSEQTIHKNVEKCIFDNEDTSHTIMVQRGMLLSNYHTIEH